MADYAPNYTNRYRVRYRVLGANHSMTWRSGRVAPNASAMSEVVSLFLDALAPSLEATFTILGADFAAYDSDVFLPAPLPTITEALGSSLDDGAKPGFLSFVGRSDAGSQARLMVFGPLFNPAGGGTADNDWRLTTAENSTIAAAVNSLNLSTIVTAIDGNAQTWYPYANFGYHAHWQRKARRG